MKCSSLSSGIAAPCIAGRGCGPRPLFPCDYRIAAEVRLFFRRPCERSPINRVPKPVGVASGYWALRQGEVGAGVAPLGCNATKPNETAAICWASLGAIDTSLAIAADYSGFVGLPWKQRVAAAAAEGGAVLMSAFGASWAVMHHLAVAAHGVGQFGGEDTGGHGDD